MEDAFDGVIILDDQDLIARSNQLGLDLLGLRQAGRLQDLPAAMAAAVRAARCLFEAEGVVSRAPQHLELGRDLEPGASGRRILEYTVVPFGLKKISAVDRNASDAAFMCLTVRDITERQLAQEHLQFMAHHDSLTGLYNRRALEARLDDVLLGRQAEDTTALVSFDLDRFKYVNDTLGHPIGDKLLVEVAKRAADVVEGPGIVARVAETNFAGF